LTELKRRAHELISALVLNQCLLITLTRRQIAWPTCSSHLIRFVVFKEMNMHMVVYLTMTPCSLVDGYGYSTSIILP
jgi:hypothetical protein